MERQRIILWLLAVCFTFPLFSQVPKGYVKQIKKHRKKAEKEFRDPDHSPFRDQADTFEGNQYYPIDPAYRVTASLELTPDSEPFQLATSDPNRLKTYVRYAILHFDLNGKANTLEVYRSVALQGVKKYRDYLFLPFTDLTTGETTYGGGRYLDLEVPEGDSLVIDFNMAYNPYCAYRSDGWSCPIPPDANRLDIAIEAGVKDYGH